MIEIYHKETNGIWFGITITNQQILSTAFSLSNDGVKTRLVNKLSHNLSFKFIIKTSRMAENVLTSMKFIYDGKNFNLVNEKL
jgi:hypothetical protein